MQILTDILMTSQRIRAIISCEQRSLRECFELRLYLHALRRCQEKYRDFSTTVATV